MMMTTIAFCLLFCILVMLVVVSYRFRSAGETLKIENKNGRHEEFSRFQNLIYALIVLVIIALLVCLYLAARGTAMEAHLNEWLNIIVRVMHITFGIAWIGASFYFVFLENALNRKENLRDELAGNLWAIHGGGFYYLEKYKLAPREIPKQLHWFKYEAYFTWLSGIGLLFIVYYFNARAMVIDKNVLDLSPVAAIAIGLGSFILAWFIYHLLCKTRLVNNGPLFAIIGFIIATGFAYFYSQVFNSRAAYIHFGAMLGTLMAANVFFIIIPSQKAMVKAAKDGKPPDPKLGKHAGLRSLHNNYFTLPVLFVMVSNHFPSTFGYRYPWLILAIITLGSAGIKHYLNLKEKGQLSVWVLPVSIIILLAAAFISAPQKEGACRSDISFSEINSIITKRCTPCHSSKPTDDVYKSPPNGVSYDTPDNIVKLKDKIMQRVVITKTMPQNNKTGMTPEERDAVRCWIEQGARLK
jgi:uncharacterized membrane protein